MDGVSGRTVRTLTSVNRLRQMELLLTSSSYCTGAVADYSVNQRRQMELLLLSSSYCTDAGAVRSSIV
jgi:hypothetical protein